MAYLFVDGRYLSMRIQAWADIYTGGETFEMEFATYFDGYEKVFYYDALPTKKVSEPEEEFAVRQAAVEECTPQ